MPAFLALTAATAVVALTPAVASASTPSGAVSKITLNSAETPAQAAKWEKGDWRQTLAYCRTFGNGPVPTNVCGAVRRGPTAMRKKQRYTVAVGGLIAVHNPWPNPVCGTPVTMPDGSMAGTDAQFEFANSDPIETCYLQNGPARWGAFRWSLDGGKTWTHPAAIGKPKAPSADHEYTFTATGSGRKPLFRWYDVATTDNHGSLLITYREKRAPAAS